MWRYVVASLLLFVTAADARNFWPDGRPANFYQMSLEPEYASIANRDPAICSQVLKALNKPHKPADMNISTNTNIVADILLSSQLDVSRQRVQVLSLERMLDFATAVDIANNGHPWVVVLSPSPDGHSNILEIFDHLPEQLRSGEPVDPHHEGILSFLGGTAQNDIYVNSMTTPELPEGPDEGALFFNVITVGGRVEILAAIGNGPNEAVWRRKSARVVVYVVDYQPREKLHIVCRFESKQEVREKRGGE